MQLHFIILLAALTGSVCSSHLNRVHDVMDERIIMKDSMGEDRIQHVAEGYREGYAKDTSEDDLRASADADQTNTYPTSCEELRKLVNKPLPSGKYKIYETETVHNEETGFQLIPTEVYCSMDGDYGASVCTFLVLIRSANLVATLIPRLFGIIIPSRLLFV